jgi:hypothetical protein
MRTILIPMVLTMALSLPALAQNQGGNGGGNGGNYRGAPGPVVGAGLSVLLLGGGIYCIVRRKKRQN